MQPATIEHVIPGRIRLRFAGERGNKPFFEQLVALVSRYPAVEEVRANPLTGSVVVRHSASFDELGRVAVQMGLVSQKTLGELKAQQQTGARRWAAALLRPGQSELPPMLLTGLGILQMLRGRMLGPASETFWHASWTWQAGLPHVALGLAFLGLAQASRGRVLGSATSLLVYALVLHYATQKPQSV